ncbi:diguanylate cyclase domain-containing protein [Clostridium grantii]|uniref:Diguanylate cyclase, GGDEF domain n=1 Tax=Clostridium grantii DSM 8605 TaxID=1121316 RepID=A0A1M5X7Q0_9CLOT|nr:diguanylate cyclase [Clostridium grantii]SHH95662.1 Diguanylate cyclase, GGDEF domain [Clostridium grantii DSM 8605]
MKSESRDEDILVRTGGDEFVMLLPKTNSIEAELIVNSRIEKNQISVKAKILSVAETYDSIKKALVINFF